MKNFSFFSVSLALLFLGFAVSATAAMCATGLTKNHREESGFCSVLSAASSEQEQTWRQHRFRSGHQPRPIE